MSFDPDFEARFQLARFCSYSAAAVAQNLLTRAKREGWNVSVDEIEQLDDLQKKYVEAAVANDEFRRTHEESEQATRDVADSFQDAILSANSFGDAIKNLTVAFAELLAECCAKSGLDAETLIAATRTPEVKQQLIANTELALDAGVFGSPSFLVHDAPGTSEPLLVFGSDRFDQLCHTLDLPWDGPTGIHRSAL